MQKVSTINLPADGTKHIATKAFMNCGRIYPKGTIFEVSESCQDTITGGLRKSGDTLGLFSTFTPYQFNKIFTPAQV